MHQLLRFNMNNSGLDKMEIINIANEIWGEHTWSYGVTNETIDFIDANSLGHSVGVAAVVKVQTESGVFREELGYAITNGPSNGMAIYEARRNAITNGLFEACISFGGILAKRLRDLQSNPSPDTNNGRKNLFLEAPAQLGSLVLEADMFTQDFNSNTIIEKAPTPLNSTKSSTLSKESLTAPTIDNVSQKEIINKPVKLSDPSVITSTSFVSSDTQTVDGKNLFISELPKQTSSTSTVPKLGDDKAKAERLKRQRELKEEFLRKKTKPSD